jgi:hypothetical protein
MSRHGDDDDRSAHIAPQCEAQIQTATRWVAVVSRLHCMVRTESHRSGLNRRPLDYESSALPLSYGGMRECPGADSNRDAFRHHPLKMACLPISPPGPNDWELGSGNRLQAGPEGRKRFPRSGSLFPFFSTGLTGLEPATSGVTDRHSNQLSYSPSMYCLAIVHPATCDVCRAA